MGGDGWQEGAVSDREEQVRKRRRPEASLHGSRSRDSDGVEREIHQRGGSVSNGLPRRRPRDVPHPRTPGTNGSWPSAGEPPRPPAICAIYDDEAQGDLLAEEERLRRGEEPLAVFGQYPRALIPKLLPWLACQRHEVLHICSGSLPPGEGVRVDVRRDARPDILADGRCLPLRDGSVAAVMIDPPYTPQYAKDLYGVEYPRPSHLLAEAARVVRPCGRIAFVHYLVPMPPPRCRLVRVFALSTGFGFYMRGVTVFEREQDELPLEAA